MHLYTAPSAIHGLGLFTNKQIEREEAIGVIFLRINSTGVFKNDFKENLLGRFTNYSEQPNAKTVVRKKDIILEALQPIKAAEEITVNYKQLIELFNHDESLIKMVKFWQD